MFKRITLFVSALITLNLFILSSVPLYGQVPTQGLVAYYPFNGDANDHSGNGNHGNTNSGCSWVLGQNGEACSFDGTGYISVPNSTSLQSPTSSLSIAFWIYIDQWNDGWASVLAKSNNSEYGQYSAEINTPAGANFWTGSNVSIYSHQLTTGRWYHVAFTWDGAQKKFYVDGNLKDVQDYSGLITPDDLPLEIGRHTPGTTEYFTGKLDNLVIYDRALTIDEVNMLSALGDGLVAYYPFNGNADDLSGNENNGYIVGSVTYTTDRFGNMNEAIQLDGTNGYVEVPNSTSLQSPTNGITLTGWVYLENYTDFGIVMKTNSNTYGEYGLDFQSGYPGDWFWINESDGFLSNVSFELSTWYFVVATLDGNNATVYVNGNIVGSNVLTGPIQADENPLTMGCHFPGGPDGQQGKLDDIRIFNRELSLTEIQELYHEGGWTTNGELLAHFQFDGNYQDISGNNNIGNGFNTSFLEDRFNQPGKAVFFNGIDSYVSVPNSASLSSPTQTISISLWFYLEQSFDIHNPFLTKSDDMGQSGQYSLNFCYCSGTPLIDLNIGNTANSIYHDFNIHHWYHLVVTYDGQQVRYYENGNLIGQTPFTGVIEVNSLPLEFGRNMPGLPDYYHGRLDDVRIYDGVLSTSEISDLYHENGWGGRELNTIIITHGFTGDGVPPLNPITETRWKHLRWQFAMADAVSDNRDIYLIRKGIVYPIEATYSQFAAIDSNSTIEYVINNYGVPRAINPDKDNVFIFDWTLESAVNKHGYAEAAADVLAATLVKLGTEYDFILDNIHFIGHSRGCVVNSEVIQRLIYWADNGMLPNGVILDPEIHMTTLDAHPAGHWSNRWLTGDFVYMDDDRVNSFNMGVVGWKSGNFLTKYIDNYFETNFWGLPPFNPFIGLDSYPGLSLDTLANNNLSAKLPTNGGAHQLVHSWYFGTVDTNANLDEFDSGTTINRTEWYENEGKTEGFRYSRNRQGPLSEIVSVQSNLIDVNSDSKLFSSGFILNGDFTDFERYTLNNNFRYNFPGWSYQDGVSSHLGGFFNPAARLSNSYPILLHNYLYLPGSSTECVFRLRVESPLIPYSIKDELEIYLDDILIKSIPINSFEFNYKWAQTNIPEIFRGRTCSLTFKLKKNNQSNDSRVDIDDIGLRYNSRINATVACPVDFHIYDNLGNHTGPTSDTTYVEEIPGSEYYIYEDSTGDKIKTVYLEPLEGLGEYHFVIESQDSTSFFTYVIEDYSDTSRGTITFKFDSIGIEPNTVATCTLSTSTQTPILEVDLNGDGTPDTTYIPIVITGIEDDQRNNGIISIPKEFNLSQNYPNPFNPSTTISYSLTSNSLVQLKIFNILGQEIETLVNEEKPSGNYQVVFDANNLSSGIYFYKIQAGEFTSTKKMILLK